MTEPVLQVNDGDTIKVTGELQEYDGPEIVVYHPYQVEVVER